VKILLSYASPPPALAQKRANANAGGNRLSPKLVYEQIKK